MSNVISSNLLKYKVNKNIDGSLEIPKIFLMSRNLRKRGQIAPIEGLVITPKFTEVNECSFTVYKENNGITLPLFDKIKDNSIIKIEGFGLFQIKVSLHESDTIYKEVTGQRMQACELGQCKCTLEINTEDDIARKDYDKNYPTVFYRPDNHPEASLLHRVLTYAPTYSIGYVDPSLYNLNRQFSCKDQTVYDFLQDVAQEIGCIFVFTPDKRVINVFDIEDHCTNPDCNGSRHIVNGVCQKCKSSQYIEKGYGLDSSTFLDTRNLLEEITDTIDADSIKNCFKLVAGDDTTTNLIGQRLIGNSPYIWTFSDFEIEEFSDELREKWLSYEPFVETYQEEFNKQWDIINDCINQKLYWMSGKMPVVENPTVDASDPMKSCKNIYDEITSKITYTTLSSKKTVETTVANQVLNYAKLICPEGYEVSYQVDENGKKKYSSVKNSEGIITSFTAYIYIYLKNCKDTEDSSKDRYFYKSEAWTIPVKPGYNLVNKDGLFTSDYYLYLKQQMEIAYAKADIVYQPKYDTDYDDGVVNHLNDPDYYKNYFKEYGIQRLSSFKEAYDTCTVSLFEQNSSLTEGSEDTERKYVQLTGAQSKVSLYEELSGRYIAYSAYIETIIKEYTQIYNNYDEKQLAAKEQVDKINAICNLKTYLGDQLFSELLTFKREDTYENKNYSSDVVDEATLMSNIEEFIIAAKQEIAKACQPKHEISVKMSQLLTLSDYETVVDAFAVGNYVRSRVNGEMVKMRIVSIPINFTDIEQSNVTFSDSLVGNTQLKSIQEQIQKATSMATSFGFVEKQSERNNEQVNTMSKSISDGLNATKNMIMNSDNQDVIMDTHGLLGRELDTNTNTYLSEQYRLTNKGLIFTDNNWETIKTALGKIFFNGEWNYGLIAEVLVGKLIAGERLEISDGNRSVVIDKDGITLDGTAIKWKKKLPTSVIDGLDDSLQNFVDAVGDLQSQIDGEITSWFEDYDPSADNEPASTWETDEDKIKHEGDLFYNTDTGRAFRYIYNSSTKNHEWSIITDEAISKALADAATAQDTADRKRRVFVDTPYAPYDVGDLWAQGSSGDLYKCKKKKTETEKYDASDWEKATKYTDDTAWKNWTSESGDFGKYKKDIQSQLDGKSEATYGGSTPPSNPETGDLWFCTDSSKGYGKDKAYMYDGKTWKESNGVPDSVWDIADGKSSIFVLKPSEAISSVDSNFYHKNDLWILESDTVLSGHTKGTVMVATSDSTTFNASHWEEKVKYTDDTKANKVDIALNNYKKEISDFQKQVNTQFATAGVTQIGENYIYSPKIASGYMYITKDGCSVQIDPAQYYDADNSKVINIQANNKDVFYIKRSGGGYFAGDVVANSLTLGADATISTDNITGLSSIATSGDYGDLKNKPSIPTDVTELTGGSNILHTTDVKVGKSTTTNGVSKQTITVGTQDFTLIDDGDFVLTNIGLGTDKEGSNYAYISKEGLLKARNAIIYGTIYATDGSFSGEITASKLTLGTNVKVSTANISGLSTVATSGKYGDLTGNPDLTVYATSTSVDNKLKGYATTGALDAYLKTNDLGTKLDGLNVAYRGDVTTTQTTDATTGLVTTTSSYIGSDGKTYTNKTYTYPDSDYVLLSRENKWGAGSTAGDGKNLVKISKDGLLTANNAIIHGTIYATDGEFTGKVTATSGEFKGAVSIEGTNTLDRMQVHAKIGVNNMYDSYTRQDYQKFYSGNTEAVSNATEAIVVGDSDGSSGHSSVIGWSGGTFFNSKRYFSLNEFGLYISNRNTDALFDLSLISDEPYFRLVYTPDHITNTSKLSPTALSLTDGTNTSKLSPTQLSISDGTNTSKLSPTEFRTKKVIFDQMQIYEQQQFYLRLGSYNTNYPSVWLQQLSNTIYLTPSATNTGVCGSNERAWENVCSYNFTNKSDRKAKTDIKSIDLTWANNFIDALKPSQYKFKDNRYGKTHTGFIAQDVEEAMLSLGMKRTDFAGLVKSRKHSETPSGISTVEELNYDPDNFEGADENYDYSLRYDDFIAPLVAYCQNLKKKNTELENKLNKIYEKLGLSD